MSRIEWPSLTRVLAVIVAAAFFIATVLFVLLNFGFLGTPPEPPEEHGEVAHAELFIEGVLAEFEFEQSLLPIDFAANSLFAIGLGALALLGQGLARLADEDDARGRLVGAAFLLGGGLGAAAQLMWLGVEPVATSTQLCECGLRAEEIMARLMILNVTGGIQLWLVDGGLVAVAVGLVAAAAVGREAGMGNGWFWFSLLLAALLLVGVLVDVGSMMAPIDVPVGAIITALVAGIMVPIWAIWLARRSPDLRWEAPDEASEVTPAL